jgi:hypothetical protein
MEEWQSMGVMNYEMESATLLTMCASQGLRAGMVAGVIVNRTQQEIPNAETMKQTESHAVKIVVEAASPDLILSSIKADSFGLFFCVAPRRKTLSNWTFIQHNSILCG